MLSRRRNHHKPSSTKSDHRYVWPTQASRSDMGDWAT